MMKLQTLTFPECVHLLIGCGNDHLRRALLDSLAPAGYRIEEVRSEREAVDVAAQRRFDLVLLGLNLPESSGIEACRKLRTRAPHLRIVMVQENNRPEYEPLALDAGANDCIAAPFRVREIVARLSAVLRHVPARRGPKGLILRAGCIEVDTERRLLRRTGREVHLTPLEFDLLLVFMKNPEAAFTHAKLLRALWGSESGHSGENLRPHINGLRKRIENDPANPEYILTEPWVGYRFHNPGRQFRS
jgi:two-component system KDP operon response regulator KdpE